MSFSNRLLNAALRGWLILALCCCLASESSAEGAERPPQQGSEQKDSQSTAPIPEGKPAVTTKRYEVDCKHPAEREDAEFCEQWRSANAAEQSVFWSGEQAFWTKSQADWTERQYYLGIVGLFAVAASLFFTGWAAVAAAHAAKSADASVRLQTDLESPFVYPVIKGNPLPDIYGKLANQDNPRSPFTTTNPVVHCALRNHGRTPALLQFAIVDLAHYTMMPEEMPITRPPNFAVPPILGPDTESTQLQAARIAIPLDREALESIAARTSFLFLFGEIHFGSVDGTAFRQIFCMAYDRQARTFTPWHPRLNQRQKSDTKLAKRCWQKGK